MYLYTQRKRRTHTQNKTKGKKKGKTDRVMDNDNGFIFFYGPDSVFSQFYPCKFRDNEGRVFSCAEQYMHFHKAITFGDNDTAKRIMATKSPKEHKRLGRLVKNFDEDIWARKSIEIVRMGNVLKFSQNTELKETLLATHPKELAEASPRDRVWGVGLAANDPRIANKERWLGLNRLGEILVRVRRDIK